MKPLTSTSLPTFLERFDHFKNAEIQNITILSATSIQLHLFLQDTQRDFNWIDLYLVFEDVVDAKLPQEVNVSYIDSSDGFLLVYQDQLFKWSCEQDKSLIGTKNALCYIIAKSIKLKEEVPQ